MEMTDKEFVENLKTVWQGLDRFSKVRATNIVYRYFPQSTADRMINKLEETE